MHSMYQMARNIGVELNLAVDKINSISPNFIPPTFNTSIKNSRCLHSSKCIFEYHIFELVSLHKFVRSNKHIS